MKKIFFYVLFLFTAFKIDAQDIDPRIKEVYGDSTENYFNRNPTLLTAFTNLLQNRVKLVVMPSSNGDDKYPKLSTMPLKNKYNPNITRDEVFNPTTFNVFKYNLSFFTNKTTIYRIDNTDYVIIVEGQNQK